MAVWLPFARKLRFMPAMLLAVVALSGVWAINFFVVLPTLNPVFVTLMPYGITLISKMLFGLAMAGVLVQATMAVKFPAPKLGLFYGAYSAATK